MAGQPRLTARCTGIHPLKKTLLPDVRNLLAKLLETVNFAPSRGGKVRNGRIFL
jgi:hypothetical protein